MYTMIIVEDEEIIREGLRLCLDWQAMQIEVIGEAADGETGLKLAREWKPDIILTDVVMSGMDGIEFVRRLREETEDKDTQVIMISGHENWTYIKSALQLQVADYLLKPFDTMELEEVIRKAMKACDVKREASQTVKQMEKMIKASRMLMVDRFLQDSCLRRLKVEEQGMYAKFIDIDSLGPKPFRAVYIEGLTDSLPLAESMKEKLGLIAVFSMGAGKTGAVAGAKSGLISNGAAEWMAGNGISMGIGEPVSRLEHLHQSFQKARAALIHRPRPGTETGIWEYKPVETEREDHFFTRMEQMEENIIRAMESNERMNMKYGLRLYFDWFRKFDRNTMLYLQAYCSMMLLQVKQRFSSLVESGSPDFVSLSVDRMSAIDTDWELEEWMVSKLEELADMVHSKPDQRKVVRRIMDLIESDYQQDLSIAHIAANVHLSPNYLATLFKKETSMTLGDYVTSVRIRHAKRLLLESNMLIQEIAEQAGYKDVKYFAKLFKKEVGMPPREFREK
ncbi:MAG: hypothetical protein K0S39_4000 [Paenibacillus sp.]|jgi:two-component system response regulator YesN|nr:hypothetical protein [Paenibacillus sp.]